LLSGDPALWHAVAELSNLDDLAALDDAPTGAGQVIAVVDSGIDYNHPALGGGFGEEFKVIGGHDFIDGDDDPMDDDGHGTAVAGVLAADEFVVSGRTMRGVAPDAKLLALRVYRDDESAPARKIEASLQWLLNRLDDNGNYNGMPLAAVNMSLGVGHHETAQTNSIYADEIDDLRDLGVAVVASSGNEGIDDGPGIQYPAAHPHTIAVGATDEFGTIAQFSERGTLLDVLAPGSRVPAPSLNGGYVFASGTSFAAPFISAAAALVRAVDDSFTLADFRSLLTATADRNLDGDDEFGTTTGRTFAQLDLLDLVATASARSAADPDGPRQDRPGHSGNDNTLAVDAHGVLHYAWFDSTLRTLRYASRSVEGVWSTAVTVDNRDPEMGHYVSIAVDQFNRPAIAYFDGFSGDLRYATPENGGWNTELLDSRGSTGLYPELIFDAKNRPVVAFYRKFSQDLRVFRQLDSGVWTASLIDSDGDVGRFVALDLAGTGLITAAYADTTTGYLKYAAEDASGNFATGIVDDSLRGGVGFIDLALNDDDSPMISYYDAFPGDLGFAERNPDGDGWLTNRLATRGAVGLYTQIQTDDEGRPTVLFYDRRRDALARATRDAAGNFIYDTPFTNAGRYLSAVATDDRLIISFNRAAQLDLRVEDVLFADVA
jgi:hypothetical protein